MGIPKRVIIIFLCCLLPVSAACQDNPLKLKQGMAAPYNGYLFSEPQFDNLLKLKSSYEIDKKLWDTKEQIYQEAIKKAEKRIKGHWWESPKFNFILGMITIIAAAYVLGQID